MTSFTDLGIDPRILKALTALGFDAPMPVQEEVIPVLLSDKSDLVALAQTGTGKTAAYGIPLIQNINTKSDKPQALILCPTRELCMQITNDLKNFGKYIEGLSVVAVYGGANIDTQVRQIKKGVQVIVATPGRMLDLSKRRAVDVSSIQSLVLDEADEMLNMGFQEDLNSILSQTPEEKQTLLFSATMPREVERIARGYMHDPVEITIGTRNSGAENVNHYYYVVHAKDRYLALKRIADVNPNIYAIIFCRTRMETQEVADKLIKDGYSADSLHGDLSQAQRDSVMQKFRERNLQMLVATDVAARGIDVDDLTHIINYNLPDENEQYIHRSGRTGRAGKQGISIAIINLKEKHIIKQIEKQIGKTFRQSKIPSGKEVCEKQLFHMIDRMEKVDVNDKEINSFMPAILKKLEWLEREDIIKRFVSMEFNRFLDYYRNAPDLNIDESREEPRGSGKRSSSSKSYARLFISLGRMDGIGPQNIIGLINDVTHTREVRLGKIDIKNSFSFFEVENEYLPLVLSSMKNQTYNDREIKVEIAEPMADSYEKPSRKNRYQDKGSRSNSGSEYRQSDKKRGSDRGERKSGGYGKKEGFSGKKSFGDDNKWQKDRKKPFRKKY
jgi:ATP-dependent RNA helicase DeaD